MTLADLAAILALAAMAVIYVGFRLGERGGCPSCGGPGGSCTRPSDACEADVGPVDDRTTGTGGPPTTAGPPSRQTPHSGRGR